MQTSQLRRQVMQAMNEEPRVRNWVVIAKCSAGLAVVALIGLIGSTTGVHPEDVASARQTADKLQATERARTLALEERRPRGEQRSDLDRIATRRTQPDGISRGIVR